MNRALRATLVSIAAAASAMFAILPSAAAADGGAVYVLSNQASGNSVWVYDRQSDGWLSFVGSVATGGLGTITPPPPNGAPGIDPLASQGAIVYHRGLLFAVNAGSNEISLFRADNEGLKLLDKVPSGGTQPTSIAVRGRLVYVLNAGGVPNVTAFKLDAALRHLLPLPDSSVALPGGSASQPAEVAIDPEGEVLVVTEKGTNMIDTFRLNWAGYASHVKSVASPGQVPFGFSITRRDYVVVSEAGSGSASSYDLDQDGNLTLVSGAVSLQGQTAPCWLVTTPDGRHAYTGNAGTQSIGSYSIAGDGTLTLIAGSAASLGAAALDLGLTGDGSFLYVREALGSNAGQPGDISGFRVGRDGSLSWINTVTNVPPGAQGIAVR